MRSVGRTMLDSSVPIAEVTEVVDVAGGQENTGGQRMDRRITPLDHGNCPGSPGWRRQPRTKRSASKRTSIGRTLIPSRRTVSAAGAGVTPTSWMLKASRAVVSPNGSKLLEDGHPHRFGLLPFNVRCNVTCRLKQITPRANRVMLIVEQIGTETRI
jgi:hypothetical protein